MIFAHMIFLYFERFLYYNMNYTDDIYLIFNVKKSLYDRLNNKIKGFSANAFVSVFRHSRAEGS